MLLELLIFIALFTQLCLCALGLYLMFPVVWHADIKPLIEEMLGPRR